MDPIFETIAAGISWCLVFASLIWMVLIIIKDALQRGDDQFRRDNPTPGQRYPVDVEANAQQLHEFAAAADLRRGTSDNVEVRP